MQVFVFGVDSGQSAKHSKFLPSSSELIPEIHPCLAMGPTAIGEVVVDTLDTPLTHPAHGLRHALLRVPHPRPHCHLSTLAHHDPQRSHCGFIIHLPLVFTYNHLRLQKS